MDRLQTVLRDIPVAHRIVLGAVGAALVMGGVLFAQWVAEPSYTVLYADLDESTIAQVVDELDSSGTRYQLENGGSTVLVPKAELFAVRARLAGAGIATSTAPSGYELLDDGGLTISDFEQQVDFKRAVEGELAKTLMAMDAIEHAQVLLVIPEDELFREAEAGGKASVLVRTARVLRADEIETIGFLVSSAVEGLEADQVTIADTDGRVLSVPGQLAGAATVTDRNLRLTKEFEASLSADITRLLDSAVGPGRASVVVNATLDFDERETESETYEPESQVALRQQTMAESFEGSGSPIGGVVGVDGGPVETTEGEDNTYTRDEQTTEYGVNRVIDRTTAAPGDIERLSVAIVMDDGSQSGITPPTEEEITSLVTAAVGLNDARGDTIAVSAVAFAPVEDDTVPAAPSQIGSLLDQLPQLMGVLVLAIVAVGLLRMARRGKDEDAELDELAVPAGLPAGAAAALAAGQATPAQVAAATPAAVPGGRAPEPALVGAPAAAGAVGGGAAPVGVATGDAAGGLPAGGGSATGDTTTDEGFPASIAELVERQPEEIALLLRSWLADEDAR